MVERSLPNPSIPYSSNDTRPMYCCSKGGCIGQLRLGRTFKSRSVLPGPVERQRLHCSYKQERDPGRSQDSSAFDAPRGLCPVGIGQHDCCLVHKQDGGDTVKAPVFSSNVSLGDGSLQGRLAKGGVGPARGESVIRSAQQVSTADMGFLSRQRRCCRPVDPVVSANSGHLCKQGLSSSPSVLQLAPRPELPGTGCSLGPVLAGQSLLLPTSSNDISGSAEDPVGQGDCNHHSTRLEISSVVGHADQDALGRARSPPLLHQHSVLQQPSDTAEAALPAPISGMPSVRGSELPLLTDQARDLLAQDVRQGTHKIYAARFKLFSNYCIQKGFDPTTCPVEVVVNYLSMLRDSKNLKYQTICGYRSAISRYHVGNGGAAVGSAQLIKRVTKACFHQAPPLPKYTDIWDADILVSYLETLHPNSSLSTYDLGMKAVALLSCLSLCRQASVAALSPIFQVVDNSIIIPLVQLEKTSRPGKIRAEVVLPSGDAHPPLSLHQCISDYLARTEESREYFKKAEGHRPSAMFISNNKPFQPVKPCTLAKWLLVAMERAGISTASYKAHSVRSASASDMRNRGMSLAQVLARGNWSSNTRTFQLFYDRSDSS